MSKLNKITEILEKGKCAAFMYAGGSQPNRLRIVNGVDENCLYDIEDNKPKQFKEEKISNVFEATPALLELAEMVRKGSNFKQAALAEYNKNGKVELVIDGPHLKVITKLHVISIDHTDIGLEFGIGDKRLDLFVDKFALGPKSLKVRFNGGRDNIVKDIDELISFLEEFRDA